MLLKGYCASLFQGCTIISSGLNLMFGLVVAAVGALVALNPYAHAIKCDTIGHMMMIGGVLIVLDGALAMWGACTERVWVVKTALFLIIISLCLMIGAAGYASSVQSHIKTYAKDAYSNFGDDVKKQFETDNRCCGFDVIEEGSEGCMDTTPCGATFVKLVEKYPKMAITLAGISAIILMFSLLMTLVMLNKMTSARKKKERQERRRGGEERPTRVHKTTKLGSRFGAAKDAEP